MGLLSRRDRTNETVPGRAVIVYHGGASQALGWEVPDNARRSVTNARADVRLVGGDGAVESVKGRLPQWASWLMAEGDEIPVRVDALTGRVVAFDRQGIEAQYRSRMPEVTAAGTRQASLAYQLPLQKGELAGIREAAADVRKLPGLWKKAVTDRSTGDPQPLDEQVVAPIDGVDFDTWVSVQAAIVRDKVAPRDHDAVARRHGVPADRWPEVQRAWMARMQGNPALAQRFGVAYQRALSDTS